VPETCRLFAWDGSEDRQALMEYARFTMAQVSIVGTVEGCGTISSCTRGNQRNTSDSRGTCVRQAPLPSLPDEERMKPAPDHDRKQESGGGGKRSSARDPQHDRDGGFSRSVPGDALSIRKELKDADMIHDRHQGLSNSRTVSSSEASPRRSSRTTP
jgi:hypothetical protein